MLEVDRDLAVVQVLEGTAGHDARRDPVAFAAEPLQSRWDRMAGPGVQRTRGTARRRAAGDRHGNAPVAGRPLNPARREPPAEPVLTGVSAIDALTTLVRGQKLPIFSVAGLPHLELATQIAAQATSGGEPFRGGVRRHGTDPRRRRMVRDVSRSAPARGELVLLLNTADDPVIERILTPRIALTVAEHLAFTAAATSWW